MLFRLAVRNVVKTLPKRLAFGSFFAITMALLFLGNTLFENSDRGLAATYRDSFTAQASISAPSPEQFTLFGSDLPLIGEFLILPVLPDADHLAAEVKSRRPGASTLAQVSAAAVLALGDYRRQVPVFGVSFPEYFRFFPALRLVKGRVPDATESAVLLTRSQEADASQALGRPLVLGERLSLNFVVGNSFVSRDVTLAGVYDHPAADQLAERIVLADPETARALNGYLYGAAPAELSDETRKLLTEDLDSLLSDFTSPSSPADSPASPPKVQDEARSAPVEPAQAEPSSAWNFLLVREPGRSDAEVLADLKGLLAGRNLQVRDWRESAGGTALIAWFLRLVFNLGLFFIATVSCLILINSLSLSILERTKEIGTMRALGAERAFIGGLIGWETLLLVIGTGLAGIALGVVATGVLNGASLPLENVYLSSLFGGRTLNLVASWSGVASHALLAVVLGVLAVILPVRKALSIQPVKAISRDQ